MFPYCFLDKKNVISRKIKKLFEESVNLEFRNKESIVNYQKKNIKRLLRNAKDVPFYSQYLKSISSPQKLLQKLPIVDKKIIFDNFEVMKNKNYLREFQEINTSGTSGVKGVFLRTEDCKFKWFAHTLKIWAQNNIDIEEKHAFITNKLSKDPRKNKSYFADLLKNCNHVALSVFWDLDFQIKWLKQEKPKYLTTFPTNLEHLFNKGYVPKVEHIFTYGEPISREFQRDFESKTRIKITDFYSTTEAGIIAQQCEYKNYHINSDNYFLEILSNERDKWLKIGKLIITLFSNQVLPLVRYDIGDYVFLNKNNICKCGRKSDYFSSIIGREINQLQSKIKGKIWIDDVINYIRKIKNIKKFQIRQNKSGNIIINYVGEFERNEHRLKGIKEKIKAVTGNGNNVKVVRVRDIKREESGKFPLVIRKF